MLAFELSRAEYDAFHILGRNEECFARQALEEERC